MIILSGVLVVVAIALLVTGIVTGNTGHEILGLDGLKLIYVSIGVSIVSALFLAVGVFLRRKELFGTTAPPANAKASAGRTTARPVKAKARVGAGENTPIVPATSATATDVPAETTVWVVPGRKRYHLETCRQLAGRDKEELTFVEAREEGFTACTACLPDTALAARAALTDTEPVGDRLAETRTAADTDTKPHSAALDPVEVTRTDIPVTPALPAAERPPAEERDARTGSRATTGGATEPPKTDARDAESTIVEPAAAESTSAEVTDAEASEETLVERSRRRSRSLFEPMQRTESDDTAAADTTDAGSATDEKTGTGSPDAGHRQEDEAATARSADEPEPEAVEPQDAPGTADEAADVAATAEADDTDRVGAEAQDDRAVDATADHGVAAESETAESETAESETAESETAESETAESEAVPSDEHGERDDEPVAAEAATEPEPVDDETDATAATDATDVEPDADAATQPTESSADADAEQAEEAEKAEPADDSGAATADPTVRILSGTKRYHRSDCALIEGIADDADDLESMSREAARDRGCTPCLVCQPDDD